MRRRRLWIAVTIICLTLALLTVGYYLVRRAFVARAVDLFRAEMGSALIGVQPGDTVPKQGRVIREMPGPDKDLKLIVPIGLYPGARVQAIHLQMSDRNSTLYVIMESKDPPSQVVSYYSRLWRDLEPKFRHRDSLLYEDLVQGIGADLVLVGSPRPDDDVGCAEIARGPTIRQMSNAEFYQWTMGKVRLSLEKPRRETTEIDLMVPVSGSFSQHPSQRKPK